MKKVKLSIFAIITFACITSKAQLLTPQKSIQGNSTTNGVSIGSGEAPSTMLDVKGNEFFTSMNWLKGIRLMSDNNGSHHGSTLIWDKGEGGAPYNFFMAGPAGSPKGDFFSGFALSLTTMEAPIYTQRIISQTWQNNPVGSYQFYKNIIVYDYQSTNQNKVGIGLENPTEQLHVKLGVRFEGLTNNNNISKILVQDQNGKLFWREASTLGSPITISCGNINYLTKNGGSNSLSCSQIYDNGTFVGIGTTTSPSNIKLNVNGNVKASGFTTLSTKYYQENIVSMNGSLDKILKLNAVTYNWNSKAKNELNFDSKNHIGIDIDNLINIFPNIVNNDGTETSVNYIELIPVLINAIQEQNNEIVSLKNKVTELENKITNQNEISNTNITDCILYQNSPNPFNKETKIKYFLSEISNNAVIYVYNMNGNPIKNYKLINKGTNELIINSNELNTGMYIYSLIVDGKEIDTKRMIITE